MADLIAAGPDALRNCSAETPGALAAFELTELLLANSVRH